MLNIQFIVLMGPKHSGKTTVGRELAALLSCRFADLDDCIAQKSGKSPRALYMEGPQIFREAEAQALEALFEPEMTKTSSPLVIASGGGLIDNPDALALFEKNPAAVSVFLDVSAKTAWERISKAGELPPFLKTEDPEKTHYALHERRAAAYRQFASLVITADGKSSHENALEIANSLNEHFP